MHSASKKISVVVPCYKVEEYLPRCLDSLMEQTLDDYEVICINDGSPDSCLDILREYEREYPAKIVVIDKKNEGTWKGRKDAIAMVTGEYIGFLDSDDYVDPTFLKDLYDAAKAEDADIAVCGFKRTDLETGKVLSVELDRPRRSFSISEEPGLLLELNGAPWNKIFRSVYLKEMDDLGTIPPIFDDMMLHLLAYKNMTGRVVFVPTAPIHYMVRSDSIINTVRADQIEATRKAMLEVAHIYHQECNADKIELLDAMAFLHFGVSLAFRLGSDPNADLKTYLAENNRFLDNYFSTWDDSPFITSEYARNGGGGIKKLVMAKRLYDMRLFRPALSVYRCLIEKAHIDIKW